MTTTAVNLRVDQYDCYVGRAGHGEDGIFGNPFQLGVGRTDTREREQCLRFFAIYFLGRLQIDGEFRRRVGLLEGKRLGCFCAPKGGLLAEGDPVKARCHAQIIAAYVDGLRILLEPEGEL